MTTGIGAVRAFGRSLTVGALVAAGLAVWGVAAPASASAAVWGPPTEFSGTPGGAGVLTGVSCVSATDCTAVGQDGNEQPFYVTETAAGWGTPAEISGTPGGAGRLLGVSCVSPIDCSAVGQDGNDRPFYVTRPGPTATSLGTTLSGDSKSGTAIWVPRARR